MVCTRPARYGMRLPRKLWHSPAPQAMACARPARCAPATYMCARPACTIPRVDTCPHANRTAQMPTADACCVQCTNVRDAPT
eukprot:353263-Chlamydomonas_euryale.AAC.2